MKGKGFSQRGITTVKPTSKDEGTSLERIHKIISKAGITSRRKAEKLILEGRVEVDGKIVRDPALKVNPYPKE